MKVFISYEHNSWPLASVVNKWLESKGHIVYWDFKSLFPGMSFEEKISSVISDSEVFILIVSKASLTSKWVAAEIAYAKALQKVIIPLKLQDVSIDEVLSFPFLGKVQVLTWGTNQDISEQLDEALLNQDFIQMLAIHPNWDVKHKDEIEIVIANGSKIDFYDVQVFVTFKVVFDDKSYETFPDQPFKEMSLNLIKDHMMTYSYKKTEILKKCSDQRAISAIKELKKGNVVQVLCKFSFQNQERYFSVYEELDFYEFTDEYKRDVLKMPKE